MIFRYRFKGKDRKIDVEECNGFFSQLTGLMFRKYSKPLLFNFKSLKRRGIHSCFCVSFFAIWFNNNHVVDVKLVKPWRPMVLSKEKFNKLLEIPSNSEEFEKFADDGRNI